MKNLWMFKGKNQRRGKEEIKVDRRGTAMGNRKGVGDNMGQAHISTLQVSTLFCLSLKSILSSQTLFAPKLFPSKIIQLTSRWASL